jgi:periplasmic protein CpxP/Spy
MTVKLELFTKETPMSRPWMGYLAGAAFALSAAGAAAAYGQAAPASGDHARVEREERTVIVRHGGEGEERTVTIRHGGMDQAEHLRTMLQLKPNQEAALNAYLAATRPEHRHERIVEMSDRDEAKTTTQRLAEMETHLNEETAQAHARIEATRKFYGQLEPSQRKVFDELPMMMGPMGPMMMHMGPMKVMVNMARTPPMPPMPPMAPRPPRAPPAPPAPPSL